MRRNEKKYGHYRICTTCSCSFDGTKRARKCPTCRSGSYIVVHKGSYKCVFEPADPAAFKGNFLPGTQFRDSVKDGVLPSGSIWVKNGDQAAFIVRGNERWMDGEPLERQSLEPIGDLPLAIQTAKSRYQSERDSTSSNGHGVRG